MTSRKPKLAIESFDDDLLTTDHKLLNWISKNFLDIILVVSILVGFVIRLIASLMASGILHPDEVYQSLEIAHNLVYGYGHIPPEFRLENIGTPSYASSRSYIFPLLIAMIMHLGEFFNLDYHYGILPLIKVILAINATLLIPVTYKLAKILTEDKLTSVIATLYVSFWFRIVEFTVRSFYNTFFLPYLFYGIYRVIYLTKSNKKFETKDYLGIIFGLGMVSYVRVDLLIIIFAVVIMNFNLKSLKKYPVIALLGIIGWIISAIIDYSYYRKFMVVPIHWFQFNIIESNSDWFGLSSPTFYIQELIRGDFLVFFTVLSTFCILFLLIYYKKKMKDFPNYPNLSKSLINLFGASIISWFLYSNPWRVEGSHKELRFAISALVLSLITFAVATTIFATLLSEFLSRLPRINKIPNIKIHKSHFYFILIILLFASFSFSTYRGFTTRYHDESFDDVNDALIYVGNQDNVESVTVMTSWYYTGGYSYLHQDVEVDYYTLTNPDTHSGNKFFVERIIRQNLSNYFVLPTYQLIGNEWLYEYLTVHGWIMSLNIEDRCEVWSTII